QACADVGGDHARVGPARAAHPAGTARAARPAGTARAARPARRVGIGPRVHLGAAPLRAAELAGVRLDAVQAARTVAAGRAGEPTVRDRAARRAGRTGERREEPHDRRNAIHRSTVTNGPATLQAE